jgi:putative transcriptional regulator
MPIVVKLDEMLHARRMTLTELAERIDITLANLSILKTGKARAVRFSTLEAICDVMQCQPGDLLEYAPPPAVEEAPVADQAAASSSTDARPPLKRPLNVLPEEA